MIQSKKDTRALETRMQECINRSSWEQKHQEFNTYSKSVYDNLNFLNNIIKHRSSTEPKKHLQDEDAINSPRVSIETHAGSSSANILEHPCCSRFSSLTPVKIKLIDNDKNSYHLYVINDDDYDCIIIEEINVSQNLSSPHTASTISTSTLNLPQNNACNQAQSVSLTDKVAKNLIKKLYQCQYFI